MDVKERVGCFECGGGGGTSARRVFYEVWQGEALLFSTVAHHWEHHLANAADDNDWIVVADLDEHVQITPGLTVPGFLGKVDQMGYSLVHGAWVDRVADQGRLAVRVTGASLEESFPLQCTVGRCNGDADGGVGGGVGGGGGGVGAGGAGGAAGGGGGGNGRGGGRGNKGGINTYALHGLHHYSSVVGVVGGGQRIFAHKAQYPILDVRTLQDFGLDDVVTASRLVEAGAVHIRTLTFPSFTPPVKKPTRILPRLSG